MLQVKKRSLHADKTENVRIAICKDFAGYATRFLDYNTTDFLTTTPLIP